ncbi:ATP-binding protein [Fibrobacterota bacterium]
MNIYFVPMFISGILCTLLSVITWLLRRRENISRTFAFFTLALAVDSFSYFLWFHYGSMENIKTWMRAIMSIGTLIPIGLILFFFAFTGYDKRLDTKVLWIKVKYFRIIVLSIFVVAMALSAFTQLMIKVPEAPKDIWDMEMGLYGNMLMTSFAFIFIYMLVMVFKSYRRDGDKPRRRFILMLAFGTLVWVLSGYTGIVFISPTGLVSSSFNYIGTALMAVIYFVAIVNYQAEKERELNINLKGKVQQLQKEIAERERVEQLAREQQEKLIQSDKMASVGILVSGVAHEINNPNNYMLLNSNNLADVWKDLKPFLDTYLKEHGDFVLSGIPYSEIGDDITAMINALNEGPERIKRIVQTLKDFARKDPGSIDQFVDINAVIEASATILANLIKKSTDRFTAPPGKGLPKIKGNFQQLEQVVINLLSNSCQALENRSKEISVAAEFDKTANKVMVAIRDQGKGIAPEDMKFIMDPFFTTKRDKGGTGLGLSISYKIIHDHKGELKFESEPGKGTTATIILPVPGA